MNIWVNMGSICMWFISTVTGLLYEQFNTLQNSLRHNTHLEQYRVFIYGKKAENLSHFLMLLFPQNGGKLNNGLHTWLASYFPRPVHSLTCHTYFPFLSFDFLGKKKKKSRIEISQVILLQHFIFIFFLFCSKNI